MFTEFNSVPGNGDLVSVHYNDESRHTLHQPKRLQDSRTRCTLPDHNRSFWEFPSQPVVSRNTHISSRAQLFSDPRNWFRLGVKKKAMKGCEVTVTSCWLAFRELLAHRTWRHSTRRHGSPPATKFWISFKFVTCSWLAFRELLAHRTWRNTPHGDMITSSQWQACMCWQTRTDFYRQ
jgi:hypothetical protein